MPRHFKNWIDAYMQYAQFSEAPRKFHFWTAASVIAGALRRQVWIDQRYFQWTPNMYIIFVAPPGIISKTTTANIGMNLLREVPGIHFGPDAVTWQALAQSLAASTEEVPIPNPQTGEIEYHAMSAITIVSGEFGTFLDPKDREMVDVLVSLWDGQKGAWVKRTKTAGEDTIINPWVNIIACTTPSWIHGNFPEYMIGGGFTSRCIFVFGDKKRKLIAYPGLHGEDAEHDRLRDALIEDLTHIASLSGEMVLTPEAVAWGEKWYEMHYKDRPIQLADAQYAGYLARKQTHIHKLAIILAAAESDEPVIREDHLSLAEGMISGMEQDLPRIFRQIGATEQGRQNEMVALFIRDKRKLTRDELYAHFLSRLSMQDIENAVNTLIHAGGARLVQLGEQIYIMATDKLYEMLPEVEHGKEEEEHGQEKGANKAS